jgi:hypothetical protein
LANLVTVVALIAVSCLITYFGAQRTLQRASANAREQLELRLEGFTGAIAALELSVAELTRATASLSAAAAGSPVPATPVASAARTNGALSQPLAKPHGEIPDGEIATEILIVIGAAVTSFLGKKVRIRSAKMLQSPYEIVNPWAQQGRVIVQPSHSLRSWSR